MYFLFLVVLGGAPSLGPSKTGFLLVDAGYRHRESPGEIFDLKMGSSISLQFYENSGAKFLRQVY